MKKVVCLAVLLVVSIFLMYAGPQAISGTVTDSVGEPLIGVSVVELDSSGNPTTTGTLTDDDGHFTITCRMSHSLRFSLLGYKTKTCSPSHGMTVVLEEDI